VNTLTDKKHVHFIGIGGIGISAIARLLIAEGIGISGSDRSASDITNSLQKAGATIFIGHAAENLPANCDTVVYTVAVPADNPELTEARRRNLSAFSYPQTLEIISREKFTIAVSGTHGKTTTTAMLGSILIEAGLDPTILVGSLMTDPRQSHSGAAVSQHGTNFISGKSRYFVVEADEYKKSFHNLFPKILVITNIDADHLDFYKDLADIQASFAELARRVPADGFIICTTADPHLKPVIDDSGISARILDYSTHSTASLKLHVPGAHNRQNAAAAGTAAAALGVSLPAINSALEHFRGTWRRFQYKGETTEGALVFDDYAHNPKKVAAAIAGAREAYPKHRIITVFQPHLYSRTKSLFNEFVEALGTADHVILLPIYAAREQFDPSISSDMLNDAINTSSKKPNSQGFSSGHFSTVCSDFSIAKEYLTDILKTPKIKGSSPKKPNLIIVMGAGDVNALSDMLVVE
jgi:UDP-N-acetylmuramate--alanine ligase